MTPQLVHIPNYVDYLGVTLDETDDQARQKFVKRFGSEPQEVVRDHCLIFVGPVPKVKP